MKFSIGYFAKPRAPGIPPALLATYTGDFNTVDDARKAAIADAEMREHVPPCLIDFNQERKQNG
jgi:hypothetical protein